LRPVNYRRCEQSRPIETEFTFDDAPGGIDSVDVDGYARLAGNDDLRLALRQSRRSGNGKQQGRLKQTHERPAITQTRGNSTETPGQIGLNRPAAVAELFSNINRALPDCVADQPHLRPAATRRSRRFPHDFRLTDRTATPD
jgi:hypothetical protein